MFSGLAYKKPYISIRSTAYYVFLPEKRDLSVICSKCAKRFTGTVPTVLNEALGFVDELQKPGMCHVILCFC